MDEKKIEQVILGKDLNELLSEFKIVNPSFERLFNNKTQRGALERLVKKYGFEKVSRMIKYAGQSNGQEFAPSITTPYELEAKLGKLIIHWHRQNKKQNNPKVVL